MFTFRNINALLIRLCTLRFRNTRIASKPQKRDVTDPYQKKTRNFDTSPHKYNEFVDLEPDISVASPILDSGGDELKLAKDLAYVYAHEDQKDTYG